MDAVRDDPLGELGVGGLGLGEHGGDGAVEIGDGELLVLGELREEVSKAQQDGVVAAGEAGFVGDVVVGRGLDGRDADAGSLGFQLFDDVPVAVGIGVEDLLFVGADAAVVHAEHDGDNGGLVGEYVAGEAFGDAAAGAAGDAVAAPARVGEGDLAAGEAGDGEGLREGRIEPLVGDGVTEEDDAVAVFEVELLRESGGGEEGEKGRAHGGIVSHHKSHNATGRRSRLER